MYCSKVTVSRVELSGVLLEGNCLLESSSTVYCLDVTVSRVELSGVLLETGVHVASKVGNLLSKFGHARPLVSRIICNVRNRRTDKIDAYCPLPYGRGHNKLTYNELLC